jgi:hypothetical protein
LVGTEILGLQQPKSDRTTRKAWKWYVHVSSFRGVTSAVNSRFDVPVLYGRGKKDREIGKRDDTLLFSFFVRLDVGLADSSRGKSLGGELLTRDAAPTRENRSNTLMDSGRLKARRGDNILILVIRSVVNVPLFRFESSGKRITREAREIAYNVDAATRGRDGRQIQDWSVKIYTHSSDTTDKRRDHMRGDVANLIKAGLERWSHADRGGRI